MKSIAEKLKLGEIRNIKLLGDSITHGVNGIELNSVLRDGLHPNNEGYKVMFTLLKTALKI